MRKQRHQRDAAGWRGFTLVEVLLSLGVIVVLMLGAQSAILLAARALPDGRSKNSAIASSSRALDLLSTDLMYVTSISINTTTELAFTVPDRDGSGTPETIHYLWSGTPGTALTRQVNNGAAVTIADKVQAFQLTYDKRTELSPTTYTTGAETLLQSYDPTINLGNFAVQTNDWVGEGLRPSLPANTASWRITRVKFKARIHGPAIGSTLVQLRALGGSTPLAVLEQKTMLESSLTSSYTWQDFSFSNVSGLAANAGVALTFEWVSGVDACDIQYQSSSATASNAWLVSTSNAGSYWSVYSSLDMPFYLYGTITTTDASTYIYRLTNVRCALRTGNDSTGGLTASVRVLNEPQVAGP